MSAEYLLTLEFNSCVEQLPKEIIIEPSLRTFKQWQVFMALSAGPYAGKIITFNIHFDKYPQQVPDVIFQSGVVHPLIDSNSTNFRTNLLVNDWNRYTRVHDLISQIHQSFLEIPSIKNAPNPEAESLLKDKAALNQILSQIVTIDTNENQEHNTPKKWTTQKEKLCKALYAKATQ